MSEQNEQIEPEVSGPKESTAPPVFATQKPPEPKPIGRQYDVPQSDVCMDVDEAVTAIKKLHGDISADSNHPYMNRGHPLHGDYLKYATALHEAARAEDQNPFEQAMADYEANKVDEQENRYKEALELADELTEKYDFNPTTVPEDVTESQVNAWRMQKLLAEGSGKSLEQLNSMIQKEINSMQALPKVREAYESIMVAGESLRELNPDRYAITMENIIGFILDARKAGEAHGITVKPKNPKRFGG